MAEPTSTWQQLTSPPQAASSAANDADAAAIPSVCIASSRTLAIVQDVASARVALLSHAPFTKLAAMSPPELSPKARTPARRLARSRRPSGCPGHRGNLSLTRLVPIELYGDTYWPATTGDTSRVARARGDHGQCLTLACTGTRSRATCGSKPTRPVVVGAVIPNLVSALPSQIGNYQCQGRDRGARSDNDARTSR